MQTAFLLVGLAAWAAVAAPAQTDVAASLYGAFNGATNSSGVAQSPSNSAGGLLEVRHISHPWFGYEGTYSYNRANQTYLSTITCGLPCLPTTPQKVAASAHEVTADYLASVKAASFRPFALVGGGFLLDVPSSGQTNTDTATKAVFVYGAGVDWGLLPHLGLRLQYRGNLYQAPNLSKLFTSSSAFTHTAEPMIGIYFRL